MSWWPSFPLLAHAASQQRLSERLEVEDQLQRRIQLFLRERERVRSTRTAAAGAAVGTDVGSIRNDNQDRAIVLEGHYAGVPERDFVLAALCDGMGGMARGADAAVLALSTFVSRVLRRGRAPSSQRLDHAAHMANRAVHDELRGQGGATLTAVLVERDGTTTGINIGDSRLYYNLREKMCQISRDDTLDEYLRHEEGDRSARHDRHEILQFIGIGEGIKPHILDVPVVVTDRATLILTSDGAHNVPHDALLRVVATVKSTEELVTKMIKLVTLMGGLDNATVIALPQAPLAPSSRAGSDVGMTFRLWSPFSELEIWLPYSMDPTPGATRLPTAPNLIEPAPNTEPVDEGAAKKGEQPQRNRKRRKARSNDDPDAHPPKLDIDFLKDD